MMTKEQFESTNDPLCMIVSLNPETGKCLFDTYHYRLQEAWLEDIKRDFPEMIHFSVLNPAAIKERKKEYGLL